MGYTAKQAYDFIAMIAPLMQKEATARGYKIVSTAIAQAIIEGACNTSVLAKDYANHFGLKCGSSWRGDSVNLKTKEEYTTGTLTTIKDNFRAYLTNGQPDHEKGVKGYYDFISTARYANLKTAANYREYAERLKMDGYATSSTYVNTLCSTVNKYNLTQYDQIKDGGKGDNSKFPTLKMGDKNDYVKSVQVYLSALGFPAGSIDSIYGNNTMNAVKEYQRVKNLKIDGIWGVECWKSANG